MNCPFCTNPDTRVTDSRPDSDGIRRRRECLACGQRFSTVERVELGGVALVKKDGRREEFDRAKIVTGVRKACEKRPIPSGAIEALADDVEKAVLALNKAEVPSSVVGEMVMERLRALDQIAYIRGPGTWYRKGYRGSSNDDIWISNADGSNNRRLTHFERDDGWHGRIGPAIGPSRRVGVGDDIEERFIGPQVFLRHPDARVGRSRVEIQLVAYESLIEPLTQVIVILSDD